MALAHPARQAGCRSLSIHPGMNVIREADAALSRELGFLGWHSVPQSPSGKLTFWLTGHLPKSTNTYLGPTGVSITNLNRVRLSQTECARFPLDCLDTDVQFLELARG